MNGASAMFPWIVCIGVFGLGFLILVVSISNNFARLQNIVRESWANVDVALKRRHDLIPNLVETVKGYAKHEQETLQQVIEARNEALSDALSIAAKSGAESSLSNAVNRLVAHAEAYPELKADAHFLELQRELANTEDRIAAARRFYNSNVREFNTMLQSFPASMLAGGRTEKEYFELEDVRDRDTPNLSAISQ